MKSAGLVLMVIALLLTGFVGVPMKWKLGNRIGHDDFYRKAKAARKAGDTEAKRLLIVGWSIVSVYALGGILLRFS
jgi:hypothetical protein